MDFRDAPVIASDQAVEDFGKPHAGSAVDPAHDPEIDRSDTAIGKCEQVAVVKVSVKEAVDYGLAKESANERLCKRMAVLASLDQRFAVVELDSVEPFEREHSPRGPAPVDFGYVIARLGDHILAQLRRRGCLSLKIELARCPDLELRDDQPRPKPFQLTAIGFGVSGRPFVGFDRLR